MILTIYIIGVVVNYLLFRHYLKMGGAVWTTGDRIFALFTSVLSWAGVTASIVCIALSKMTDRPAKW